MLVFVIWFSFEKLKSNWNQTWVKNAMGEGFLCMLMGSTSNVMFQGQGSSEVKLGGKCKIIIIFFFLKSLSLITTKHDLLM